MTVPLTSPVIVRGRSAAGSNACTSTALPINLSQREGGSFQCRRSTKLPPTAPAHRGYPQPNRRQLAAANPAPIATTTEPRPLFP
jgi:hypothetical protein